MAVQVPSLYAFRDLRGRVDDLAAKARRRQIRPRIRRHRGGGGGQAILAVVTSCSYDDVSGTVYVTASRLLSIPYGYDPELEDDSTDLFTNVYAGIEPMLIPDMICLLVRIAPIPDNPEVKYFAIPSVSVDRSQLNPPAMECLTEFTEPCAGDFLPETCTE